MYSSTLKVRVPEELKIAVSQAAQSNNLDISSFVRLVLTRATKPRYLPNETTEQAMLELEEGKGVRVNTVDDFWENIFK